MIDRFLARLRVLKRTLSRTHLAARLLGHPSPRAPSSHAGLIMIQVDGLARRQLEKALKGGRMPHLSRLLQRQHFSLKSFYSGVPSTTPAVQGELFYGMKAVVPSFEFRDHRSGRMFRMFEAEPAMEIENRMVNAGAEPLLSGGHVYLDIFRAGAAKSRYCSADNTIEQFTRRLNFGKSLLLGLVYLPRILRIVGLSLLELGLAIKDVITGGLSYRHFTDEMRFVVVRVIICLLAREAIRLRVLLDIERAVPVIHANFLGYDEQAHRRGPDSDFAHWSLKGIDDTIRDIYRAAEGTSYIDYEMVIYSDHGQERSTPYEDLHDRPVEEAIKEVFAEGAASGHATARRGKPEKLSLWGKGWHQWLRHRPSHASLGALEEGPEKITITVLGPLGHIYLPVPLEETDRVAYAQSLVKNAAIPLVLFRSQEHNVVRAFNARGQWSLPQDGAEVIGAQHPFLAEVVQDLIALSAHPDAGHFIVSGWSPHDTPVTFPREKGAHGGPGSEETHGFVLVPDRILRWHLRSGDKSGQWLRGTDLRETLLLYLGTAHGGGETEAQKKGNRINTGTTLSTRTKTCELITPHPTREEGQPLRVMTYNIHSCVGLDGRNRPERVARVINACDPDIVAVQEVDAHRPRSGGRDQAREIAEHLRMEHAFYAILEERAEQYGIAIFSRFPYTLVCKKLLTPPGLGREARGAMWITFMPPGGREQVHFINTHFGLGRMERMEQAKTLLGPEWIGGIPRDEPLILSGDFNSPARSPVWRLLSGQLRDVQLAPAIRRPQATFPTLRALVRIDHVFVNHRFAVQRVEVPRTSTATVASDHFPLCAELSVLVPASATVPAVALQGPARAKAEPGPKSDPLPELGPLPQFAKSHCWPQP